MTGMVGSCLGLRKPANKRITRVEAKWERALFILAYIRYYVARNVSYHRRTSIKLIVIYNLFSCFDLINAIFYIVVFFRH